MSGCLGDVVAALVDGELDHAARERAQRHLAHCADCRAEVDGQRRLKARLAATSHPSAPDALAARLLALGSPPGPRTLVGPDGGPVVLRPVPRPTDAAPPRGRPVPVRPAPRAAAPPRGPGRRVLGRRALAGSALAVLGVATAFALGSPQARPASTPVDPAADAFVVDFVSTTSDGAGAVRTASLTDGGTRIPR